MTLDLYRNLLKARVIGDRLRASGWRPPLPVASTADLAASLVMSLPHASVGPARIDVLGHLAPAASGEGMGWGHGPWDALPGREGEIRAALAGQPDAPGLAIRFFDDGGLEWRFSADFATGEVKQVPKVTRMGVNR